MQRSIVMVMVGAACLCGTGAPAFADDAPELKAKAEFLLRGMLDARQKVRSGLVLIQGRKLATDTRGGRLEGEVKGSYRFDAPTGSYLFDWEVPCNLTLQSAGQHTLPDPSVPGTRYMVRYWACRNPEYFADVGYIPGENSHVVTNLTLRPPEYDSRTSGDMCGRRPFDPLSAGIIGYFEFERGETAPAVYEGMLLKSVES